MLTIPHKCFIDTNFARLSKNPLTFIPITSLSKVKSTLEMLDLSQIEITQVHNHGFHGLKKLKKLFLNDMTSLTAVEALAFNDLKHLELIEIRNNKNLTFVHPFAFYNTLEDTRYNVFLKKPFGRE